MNGDVEDAWRQHSGALRRFIGRRVESAAVEDLLQETFLRLLRSNGEWPHNPGAWLYKTAGRLVIDHYRTRRQTEPFDEHAAIQPGRRDDRRTELETCVSRLVNTLPASYREALTLADLEALPQQAVAERQKITLSGAKSRIQRARSMLQQTLHACCTFEFGRDGSVIDYSPKQSCVVTTRPLSLVAAINSVYPSIETTE